MDLSNFARLLVEWQAKQNSDVAPIQISENTAIGVILSQFVADRMLVTAEETETDAITSIISDFQIMIQSVDGADTTLKDLVSLRDVICARIRTAFEEVQELAQTVESLSQSIQTRISAAVARDPFLTANYGKEVADIQPSFPTATWAPIALIDDERTIVLRVNSDIPEARNNDSTSQNVLTKATTKLLKQLESLYKDVALTKETRDRISEEIATALSQSPETVRATVRIITDPLIGPTQLTKMLKAASETTGAAKALPELLSTLTTLIPVMNELEKVEVSAATSRILTDNLTLCKRVCDIMTYYCIHCRTVLYSNAIMLPTQQLNPDNVDSFISKGGSMQMLAHHLSVMYPNGALAQFPRPIRMDDVISMADRVAKRVETQLRETTTSVAHRMTDVKRNAFVIEMENFIKSQQGEAGHKTDMPFSQCQMKIGRSADAYVGDQPLENVLYDIILRIFYKDTFVGVLFRRLDIKCMNLLIQHKEVTEQNVRLVEAATITDMITEFVVKTGLMTVR